MMNKEEYVEKKPSYQYMRETVGKDENRLGLPVLLVLPSSLLPV